MPDTAVTLEKRENARTSSFSKLPAAKNADEKEVQAFEEQIKTMDVPDRGDTITGTLLHATKRAVYVDLGAFGTGVIRGRELWDSLEDYTKMDPGTPITATIVRSDNEMGMMELSFRKASRAQMWEELHRLMKEGEDITVKIRSANKGGLMASVQGVNAFLPVSQLSPENYPRVEGGDSGAILERLNQLVGRKMKVRVITVQPEDKKLIISEKEVEFAKQRELLQDVPVGTRVKGVVSGIVDFGVFVRFPLPGAEDQEVEGLVHLSELSWKRVDDPNEVLKMDETVEVEIIGVDDTKISLSIKALQPDPWKESVKDFTVGQVIEGTVANVAPFGAFIELSKDIQGLLHISEIDSPDGERVTNAHNVIKEGETVKVKIISIDAAEHRLGLSQKALKGDTAAADAQALLEVSEEELAKEEEELKKARLAKFEASRKE